jgi:hypothetical protein
LYGSLSSLVLEHSLSGQWNRISVRLVVWQQTLMIACLLLTGSITDGGVCVDFMKAHPHGDTGLTCHLFTMCETGGVIGNAYFNSIFGNPVVGADGTVTHVLTAVQQSTGTAAGTAGIAVRSVVYSFFIGMSARPDHIPARTT